MDYKEKYEQAKKLYESANDDQKYILESLFPELAESEDEKIRKAILTGLIDCRDAPDLGWSDFGGIFIDDCIAWLEKLGNEGYNPYKATVESISTMVKKYASSGSDLKDFYDNVKVKCKDAVEYDKTFHEEQGEVDEDLIAKKFLINKGYPIGANGTFPTYEELYNIIREGLENQYKQHNTLFTKMKEEGYESILL